MEDKGFITLKLDKHQTKLHFIIRDEKMICITLEDSKKVALLKEKLQPEIAIGMLSRDFNNVDVLINEDKAFSRKIFDEMIELKHCHYKAWDDRLIVLEISNYEK